MTDWIYGLSFLAGVLTGIVGYISVSSALLSASRLQRRSTEVRDAAARVEAATVQLKAALARAKQRADELARLPPGKDVN